MRIEYKISRLEIRDLDDLNDSYWLPEKCIPLTMETREYEVGRYPPAYEKRLYLYYLEPMENS